MPKDDEGELAPPRRGPFDGRASLYALGGLFLLVAIYLAFSNFWRMADRVPDAVVLTAFVTDLPPGQQRSFGYGGDGPSQAVDVPFQSPEMSNVSFRISREGAGYLIKAADDEIFVR